MFKVLDNTRCRITLRHVPDGHLYIFPVRAIDGLHFVDLGEMVENAQAFSPAYRYSQQARVFAAEAIRDWDYLALPPVDPAERPPSEHHQTGFTSAQARPSLHARRLTLPELLRWCFWILVLTILVRYLF